MFFVLQMRRSSDAAMLASTWPRPAFAARSANPLSNVATLIPTFPSLIATEASDATALALAWPSRLATVPKARHPLSNVVCFLGFKLNKHLSRSDYES